MAKQKPTMPVPEECETCRYWRLDPWHFSLGRAGQGESQCLGLPPARTTTVPTYKTTIFGRKYVAGVTDLGHRRVVTRKHDTCALHKYAKEYAE